MACLHVAGLAYGTVKLHLAAVHHARIGLGLGDPHISEMPQLEYMYMEISSKKVNLC